MHVEIYTKTDCTYCTRAKELLANRNMKFSEQKLNVDFTREILLERYPSVKTYPVVVIDGFYIGGYNELQTILLKEEAAISNKQLLMEQEQVKL